MVVLLPAAFFALLGQRRAKMQDFMEWLERPRVLAAKMQELMEDIETLRGGLGPRGVRYDRVGSKEMPTEDMMAETMAKIDALERQLRDLALQRAESVEALAGAFCRLEAELERRVPLKNNIACIESVFKSTEAIYCYYMTKKTVAECAEDLHLSIAHFIRLKKQAVSVLAEIMNEEE